MNRSSKHSAWSGVSLLRWGALALVLTLAACKTAPKREDADGPVSSAATEEAVKAADKGDPESRFAAALELMKTKKTAEAEAAFIKLSQDFPDYTGPHTNIGILYAKSNRRDAAITAFKNATNTNPKNAPAFNWLGVMYREAGDYPNARKSYEKALQINSGYAAAQLNLGLLFDEYLKQPNEALPHYREYLRLYGKEDLRVLAWIAEIESAQKAAAAKPAEADPAAETETSGKKKKAKP